jgi:UTP-glucose-1-phosphate uridylyltransferase
MKPTLLILAAGMGSRYGGLKQIDEVGPAGETIIEYSIFDAIRAGFGKVVFVIRRDFEDAFKAKFEGKFTDRIDVAYAYQEVEVPVEGLEENPPRQKPWGTGHAVLVAADVIREPFAVINADDYYGVSAFKSIADFLTRECTPSLQAMVGYVLENTLSDHGTVSRGVCAMNDEGYLTEVVERKKVRRIEGRIYHENEEGLFPLKDEDLVSMNLWGFHPTYFTHLRRQFNEFARENRNNPSAEFYIPLSIDQLIRTGLSRVKVLPNREFWYGVTYREDKPIVQKAFAELAKEGRYPVPLWD